jgi:hypothetical protein
VYRLIRRSVRNSLADRVRQEEITRTSGLDWTLVRPPRLRDGKPTGAVRAGEARWIGPFAAVDRADLGGFLLGAVADPVWIGRAVAVLSPRSAGSGTARAIPLLHEEAR